MRVVLVTLLVIGACAVVGGVMVTQPKVTNCVISKDNPYKDMPMVCKVVLKIP